MEGCKVIADAREELLEGRGFVYLRGLPVQSMSAEDAVTAYLGIGLHIDQPVSQNGQGHILGHVRDYGRSIDDLIRAPIKRRLNLGFMRIITTKWGF